MTKRLSIWEWACRYTGDPKSFRARGQLIQQFLLEEGMAAESLVLDVGCGNLSQGIPLIQFLDGGRYVGVEPNGWLVEAALQARPDLVGRRPRFLWRDDFDASEFGETFDFAVAHSVLSHVAHWQMELALARIRDVIREGGVLLASLRLGERNSFAQEWVYPSVSFFRLDTLKVIGYHAGWQVEHVPDYQRRLVARCPNDFHDWVRFTAVETDADRNRLRLAEEARQHDEEELRAAARDLLRDREERRLAELAAEEGE